MSLFNLKGKVAVVTGSSRGIGRSIAHQLAIAGAKVVVSSRKQDACEVVVKEIQAAGGQAMAIAASISSKEQLQNLIAQTRETWGVIDILVCNAATNPYYGPATGMSDEVFDKVMRNNVLSNAWLCNLAYPDMKAQKDGAIVIVSSIGGLHGSPVIGAYNLSKAADMQLARNLAVEWGPDNIRVNCINPVFNPDTGLSAEFAGGPVNDAVRAKFLATIPLGRFSTALDVANAALYLASDEAAFISGVCIEVDGARCV
jgi:NAD(P)-dependent dehydrogenase (short-subunit alcohol dehydrogenase family)